MGKRGAEAPWWLSAGTELCGFCGQRYAYGMERRCADCDAAMCSVCARKDAAGEIFCCDCEHPAGKREK